MARQSPCASYPILTFPEVRTSSSTSLAAAERGSVSGGEAACAVVPAAIGSAVFEATGVRVRSVPFTPAKVSAALRAARHHAGALVQPH